MIPTVRLEPNSSNRCLDIWILDRLLSVRVRKRRSPRWKRTSTGWCLRCSRKRAASTSLRWSISIRHYRTRPPLPFRNAGASPLCQHREALQCTHRRERSLLAPCRCPATTYCQVCLGTGVLHLNPVEMPDARLACRLRARTQPARTRTFPGRAKIICADGCSSDGRTGHSVDPRRFG